ncbi:Fusaric acid resistance protein-like-domain-containing protein [Zychaea mexicana]|uniref:Fusaric acid resistance protein-like-domain-containing protein n=1 Tax=Zychaea mexicana TaxID=64656 RepID=UPI0022FF29C2|nr:Fusaric acid resistance protein-like-domain-containing protein [Zychaea mexicana]KAI9493379.1 Fusaric acid resistance protein-like-domain-containing protein [Zychaea mexicana]
MSVLSHQTVLDNINVVAGAAAKKSCNNNNNNNNNKRKRQDTTFPTCSNNIISTISSASSSPSLIQQQPIPSLSSVLNSTDTGSTTLPIMISHPNRDTAMLPSSTATPAADSFVIRSPLSPEPQQQYHQLQHQQRQDEDYFGYKSHPSSYDTLSDYEVVLDDGILQRRTVSLTTVPGSYSSFLDQQRRQLQAQQDNSAIVNNPVTVTTITASESSPLLSKNRHQQSEPNQQQQPVSIESDDDDDDDGKSSSSGGNRATSMLSYYRHRLMRFKLTYPQKMVIKCSTAYMLGSLFTFVPFLNTWVGGDMVASHLAATVTVFFNPAKTVGGMVEAAGYGWLFTVCALVLCLTSVSINTILISQGRFWLSYGLTLGVWIGLSSFVIAYFKGRMNRPSTGTASALAFIIILSTLVREPSPDRIHFLYNPIIVIRQLFVLVAIGTIISVAVCLLLWPVTATKKLKSDINSSLQSVRVLLKLLTKTFLLDCDLPNFTANKQLEEAIKAHRSGCTALKQSLVNAKREHPHSMKCYDDIVSSLQRLDRHIGGLRSSCGLQFEVMQEHHQWNVKADDQRRKLEHELRREKSQQHDNHHNNHHHQNPQQQQRQQHDHEDDGGSDDSNAGELVQFIKTVRQPMKSLAYTCKQTIVHLQSQFDNSSSSNNNKTTAADAKRHDAPSTTTTTTAVPSVTAAAAPPSFCRLRQNLLAAIDLFEDSLHHALSRMYNRRNYSDLHMQLMKELPADNVFLVYFFVFTLSEFAKELTILVNATECAAVADQDDEGTATPLKKKKKKRRNSSVTLSTPSPPIARATQYSHSNHDDDANRRNTTTARSRRTTDQTTTTNATNAADNAFFLPNNHNTSNTLHTPQPNTQRHKFSFKLWSFFSLFRQRTIKFAAKNMLTAIAFSALAFIPYTQPYFYQYRMEWTLLTVMTLLTPTVGGTNVGAVLRVLATIAGCAVATLTYTLFPANPIVLTLLTWLYSIPAFWVILYHRHGRFGQVALLAYNLVVLYMYNHRNDVQFVNIGVVELAWIRCITVSLGVVIGLIVTAYIWPYEARKALRQGLSDLLIRLSWLYKHLSTTHDAEEMLFHQTECQQALVKLRDLLVHAPSEPRLKGPFPTATYNSMLNSCQNILDKFLSLRIVVLKDVWSVHVHQQLLMGANTEFSELVGNVLLYFYVLASALQLKTPLPPYLPPAERARVLLMRRLQYVLGLKSDEGYMAYYAYIALMEYIIRELNQLGQDMKDLFGSLIPQDQWTEYFAIV